MLQRLADIHGVAVLITNEVSANLNAGPMFQAEKNKAIGGHIMAHA